MATKCMQKLENKPAFDVECTVKIYFISSQHFCFQVVLCNCDEKNDVVYKDYASFGDKPKVFSLCLWPTSSLQ